MNISNFYVPEGNAMGTTTTNTRFSLRLLIWSILDSRTFIDRCQEENYSDPISAT